MLAAHQGRIFETAAAAFAVGLDVIDGEIIPGQLLGAARIGAGLARCVVPDDSALLRGKSALGVAPGK